MTTLNGDSPCSECGTAENIVWFTDSTFWNNVVRREGEARYGYALKRWGGDPILCLPCFIALAEERGYRPTGWRVLPEWPVRQTEATPTSSGALLPRGTGSGPVTGKKPG